MNRTTFYKYNLYFKIGMYSCARKYLKSYNNFGVS